MSEAVREQDAEDLTRQEQERVGTYLRRTVEVFAGMADLPAVGQAETERICTIATDAARLAGPEIRDVMVMTAALLSILSQNFDRMYPEQAPGEENT